MAPALTLTKLKLLLCRATTKADEDENASVTLYTAANTGVPSYLVTSMTMNCNESSLLLGVTNCFLLLGLCAANRNVLKPST